MHELSKIHFRFDQKSFVDQRNQTLMIHWHVETIDRQFGQAWFPDFHYQELLLPYFGTGWNELDEYGRTDYVAKNWIDC